MRLSLEKIPLRKMFAYPSQKKKKENTKHFYWYNLCFNWSF